MEKYVYDEKNYRDEQTIKENIADQIIRHNDKVKKLLDTNCDISYDYPGFVCVTISEEFQLLACPFWEWHNSIATFQIFKDGEIFNSITVDYPKLTRKCGVDTTNYFNVLKDCLKNISQYITPIGKCNRTGEEVYITQTKGYSAFNPQLDEDLYAIEFTPYGEWVECADSEELPMPFDKYFEYENWQDYTELNDKQKLNVIDFCSFKVLYNTTARLYKIEDRQGANLGDVESEMFKSLDDIIYRIDHYIHDLVDYEC